MEQLPDTRHDRITIRWQTSREWVDLKLLGFLFTVNCRGFSAYQINIFIEEITSTDVLKGHSFFTYSLRAGCPLAPPRTLVDVSVASFNSFIISERKRMVAKSQYVGMFFVKENYNRLGGEGVEIITSFLRKL